MKTLEFENSSAIAKISLDYDENQVGIAYTYKPDLFYLFKCSDVNSFESTVENAVNADESLGKLISQLRKDGTLESQGF